jgi:hypothetical protein
MNDIKQLFFHLTPSTLAAIAVDLDGDWAMRRYWDAAVLAGYDNCGAEEFSEYLAEARAECDGNDQRDEDEAGYNGEVARILARQGR